MTPQRIREILDTTNEKGEKLYVDVLTSLAEKEEVFFKSSSCPKCGTFSSVPFLNTRRPFTPESPLPNKLLRCVVCGTEFDPHTGLVTLANITDGLT